MSVFAAPYEVLRYTFEYEVEQVRTLRGTYPQSGITLVGRGGRAQSPLALSSIVTPPDSPWVVALRALEQANFHSAGKTGCAFPLPYGEPRFVVVDHSDEGPAHNLFYYETPEALLELLVTSIRLPKSRTKYAFEYQPSTSSFGYVFKDSGLLLGYAPPSLPVSTNRSKRARSIARTLKATALLNYQNVGRFLVSSKMGKSLFINEADSIEPAAQLIADAAFSAATFVNFYDLDASGQPIPIRIGLSYIGKDGKTHTFVEP